MEIDEDGDRSIGSDHNRLLIAFGGNSADTKESKLMGQCNVTQREAQMIAEKLEAEAENKQLETYEELVQWWIHHLEKSKETHTSQGEEKKAMVGR